MMNLIGILPGAGDLEVLRMTRGMLLRDPKSVIEHHFDLIVFTGGSDIDPSIYGERNILSYYNPVRDVFELKVLDNLRRHNQLMLSKGLPVTKILGICRGHQLINAFLGGSLYQDIFLQLGLFHSTDKHKIQPGMWKNGSLEELFPRINTFHHQCVKNPGRGMVPILRARDGILEATAHESGNIVTFQFHPESNGVGDAYFKKVLQTGKLIW